MSRPRTHAERIVELERSIATVLAPRPTQGPQAAGYAIRRAEAFACLVRDEGADTIGAYLDALTPDQLYALTVTLAAMVPVDDATAEGLLAWTRTAQEPAA